MNLLNCKSSAKPTLKVLVIDLLRDSLAQILP